MKCCRLSHLNLSHNLLSGPPMPLSSLPNLATIDLSHNRLGAATQVTYLTRKGSHQQHHFRTRLSSFLKKSKYNNDFLLCCSKLRWCPHICWFKICVLVLVLISNWNCVNTILLCTKFAGTFSEVEIPKNFLFSLSLTLKRWNHLSPLQLLWRRSTWGDKLNSKDFIWKWNLKSTSRR